jgi:hypothetical protein
VSEPVRPSAAVTLEITLAPPDLQHAREVLPHQLRTWAGQVDEVVCVIDLLPVPGSPDPGWTSDGERLVELVDQCCSCYPHASRAVADYGADDARAISDYFFLGRPVPAKTYRAGPFYAYFWGLHEATNDFVLHLDSDVMFGGGSHTWVAEALRLMEARPDVLVCQPLPGPPTSEGGIKAAGAQSEPGAIAAFRFQTITTRYFLLDRSRFRERIGGLQSRSHAPVMTRVGFGEWLRHVRELPLRDRIRPPMLATPRVDLPERLLGEAMVAAGMYRLDYLGRPPGMWTLHPRERTAAYYQLLPQLIERIERGDVTEQQRGRYDLDSSMLTSH